MKHLTVIFIFILLCSNVYSQHKEESGVNLPKFYKGKMHFGFAIAYNNTNFKIHTVKNSAFPDTLIDSVRYGMKTVLTNSDPGFALGIISDFKLHEYVRLRFTPNISFASRSIQYKLQNAKFDSTRIYKKSVESTFLIFPAEIKLQSKRLDNFGAYIILGGGYTLDLATKKKGVNSIGGASQLEDAVNLKRDDYFYSGGAGVDFYLQYFKLGLECKVINGTKNLLNKNQNIFSNSVDKVNSKMFVFSITFEG